MLKLEEFGHTIQHAVYTHPYRLWISHANFFWRKHKNKCKSVLGHWYGLFILCASYHKTQFWVKSYDRCNKLQTQQTIFLVSLNERTSSCRAKVVNIYYQSSYIQACPIHWHWYHVQILMVAVLFGSYEIPIFWRWTLGVEQVPYPNLTQGFEVCHTQPWHQRCKPNMNKCATVLSLQIEANCYFKW